MVEWREIAVYLLVNGERDYSSYVSCTNFYFVNILNIQYKSSADLNKKSFAHAQFLTLTFSLLDSVFGQGCSGEDECLGLGSR